MANKDLKCECVVLSDKVWFYEETRGIAICTADSVRYITWRRIRNMLKRKDK